MTMDSKVVAGLEAYQAMGVNPHSHDWVEVGEKYVDNPSWILRRTRYAFRKCCGRRQRRLTIETTEKCSVTGCEMEKTSTSYRVFGFCEICGGIYEHTTHDYCM